MNVILPICVFFFCFLHKTVIGQSYSDYRSEYMMKHYSDEDGLPQNTVKMIAPDGNGFVWMATQDGLARFDGQQFLTYNKINTGIKDTRFFAFWPDLYGNKKRLYAPTDGNNVLFIDQGVATVDSSFAKKTWKRIPHTELNYRKFFISNGLPSFLNVEGLKEMEYYILLEPGKVGSFYVLDHKKISYYQDWTIKWERKPQFPMNFTDILTHEGALYYFSPSGNIQQITQGKVQDLRLTGDILLHPGYNAKTRSYTLFQNNIAEQIFLLQGDVLYQLSKKEGNIWLTTKLLTGFDFEDHLIQTLYYDAQRGTIYMGSHSKGVYIFSKRLFKNLQHNIPELWEAVYAQAPYGSKGVILGSGVILDSTSSSVARSGTQRARRLPFKDGSNFVDGRSILYDNQGHIWNKSFHTLYEYSASGEKLLREWELKDEIKSLFKASNGLILLGMKHNGILQIDSQDAHARPIPYIGEIKDIINFITQSVDGTIWAGTDKGLYQVEPTQNRTRLVSGTEKLNVRAIYAVDDGKGLDGIFIMTYEDGFFFYSGTELIGIPLDHKGYLAASHCMVEDRFGHMWVPTNKGLFQFSKTDLMGFIGGKLERKAQVFKPYYRYFDRDAGLATNEFNGGCQPCALTLADGSISLPSMEGVTWFDPARFNSDFSNDPLFVDRIEYNGESHLNRQTEVSLPIDPERVTFHIATANHGHADDLQLAYAWTRVGEEPSPKDWVELPTGKNNIYFSKLPSGDYELLIRKVNGFGPQHTSNYQLVVRIPLHWYETWWFKLACVFLLAGLFYIVVILRTHYLKRRNAWLENEINHRIKDLSRTLLTLQGSEKGLKQQLYLQTRLIASICHDIRTPMKYLAGGAKRLEGLLKEENYNKSKSLAHSMTGSSAQMSRQLDSMVVYIKTQAYASQEPVAVSLHGLVENVFEMFSQVSQEQGNTLVNAIHPDMTIISHSLLLNVLLQNLVDNACKHNDEAKITVSATQHGDKLHLVVADDGPGMPQDLVNWFNEKLLPEASKDEEDWKGSTGLGLLIVKEMARLLHIELIAEYDRGSRISLVLPQSSTHNATQHPSMTDTADDKDF